MSALVETVFNVPTISGQVAGTNTIALTATLSIASPETVAYMEAAKSYIGTIETNIGTQVANIELFNTAISSNAQTFLDASNNSRYTWAAIEAAVDAIDHAAIKADIVENTTVIDDILETNLSLTARVSLTETSNQEQNVRLTALENIEVVASAQRAALTDASETSASIINQLTLRADTSEALLNTVDTLSASFVPQLASLSTTNAQQAQFLQDLDDLTKDHGARIFEVESNTDIVAQELRFTNIETTSTTQNGRLTSLEATDLALQADIDTRVSLSGNETIAGDKTFAGDITINGTTILNDAIVKSSSQLDVGDAVVTLNAEETGTPSVDAGFEIERGTATNAQLLWDESQDAFVAGIAGSLQPVVLDDDQRLVDNVKTSGNENIAGIKYFTTQLRADIFGATTTGGTVFVADPMGYSAPVSATVESSDNRGFLVHKGYVDDNFARSSGTQTIDGAVTFGNGGFVLIDGSLTSNEDQIFTTKRLRYSAAVVPTITNSGDLTNKGYVDDNFVDITTSQSIGGAKTFTAKTIHKGSIGTDAIGPDDAAFIFATSPIRVSGTAQTAATYNDFIHKGYVDDLDSFNVKNNGSNQSLSGNIVVKGSISVDNLNADDAGLIHSTAPLQYDIAVRNAGLAQSQLIHRGYVDDNFLLKTGGNLTGNIALHIPTGDALAIINSVQANSVLRFQRASANVGLIASTPTEFYFERQDITGNPSYRIRDTYHDFTVLPTHGIDGTHNNSFTTKGYVDGLDSENVKLTGAKSISGNTQFSDLLQTDVFATINADRMFVADKLAYSTPAATAAETETVRTVLIHRGYVDDNFVQLDNGAQTIGGNITFVNGGNLLVDGNLTSNEAQIFTTTRLRYSNTAVGTLTNPNDAINKGYVDSGFVNLTSSETIGGSKTFANNIKFDGIVQTDQLGAYTSTAITAINEMRYNPTVQGTIAAADGSRLVHKGYVDDNERIVQQASGYEFVMPSATPTTGQQLQVGSVSGTVVTMIWI